MRLVARSLVVGVLVGLVFLGFEWVVKHGTDFIWNDVVHSDDVRWRVVPLAIAGSLLFTLLVRATGQPRTPPVHTDPLAGEHDPGPATLSSIAMVLLIGGASLLAGASLGPEASLVAASAAIGAWIAGREDRGLLVAAAVGGLLVAFLGSLVPILIPLLLLYRREKRLVPLHALAVIVAGLAAYGTLYVVKGAAEGYGDLPADTDFGIGDVATAFVLGMVGVLVGALLRRSVAGSAKRVQRIDARWPWPVAAVLFGTVLGLLYLAGGDSVEFSGSEGVGELLRDHAEDGALVLAGLLAVKALATGWSLASGYRGGLIFPAVYAGVATSLLVGAIADDLAGPGATIGTVSGLLTAMTAPVPAVIMLVALLPAKLIPIALAGAAGAVIAKRVTTTRPHRD